MKKHWIGSWIIGVSILHTAFALFVFRSTLAAILQRGVFNVVGTDPMTAAVVWFVLFGAALFICGLLIQQLEKPPQVSLLSLSAGVCCSCQLLVLF
jgi:hypothetical protein